MVFGASAAAIFMQLGAVMSCMFVGMFLSPLVNEKNKKNFKLRFYEITIMLIGIILFAVFFITTFFIVASDKVD